MSTPDSVNPTALYSSEPAPMGIADFGVGHAGASYTYSTTEFLGNFSWQKLKFDGSGGTLFSDQLNVVLQFVQGGKTYAYWIQDVAFMDSANGLLTFENNIWNFSTGGCLSPSDVVGNGTVYPYQGCQGYYAVGASGQPGASEVMPSPGNFQLLVRSYISAGGLPEVAFEYRDGVTSWYVTYDNVVWPWASQFSSDNNFVVDGSQYNPLGLFYDAELGIGGPGGGLGTVAQAITHTNSQLLFWNGHNFQAPISAWNFGSDTAEAVSNIQSIWSADSGGTPRTLQLNGTTTDASPDHAYDQNQVGFLHVSAPSVAAGTIAVRNVDWNFVSGWANLTLNPGTYSVWVNSSGSTNYLGLCPIAGGTTLVVDTTHGCGPTTSTPAATPAKADLGQTVIFQTTPGSLGSGGDTFSWNVAPNGLGCGGSSTTTLLCAPTSTGTYRVNVTIKDSLSDTSTSGNLTYVVAPDPSAGTPSASRPSVETGGTVNFTTTVSGGVSPYSFAWNGLPAPCAGTSGASPTCTPTTPATYTITVNLTDANGYRATSATLDYTVGAGPSPSTPTAAPIASVDVGQPVKFTTSVTGGSGILTYRWTGLPTGCSPQNLSQLTCDPSASGIFGVSVAVGDSNGGSGTSGSLAYPVDSDPVVQASAPPRSIDVGQASVFTAVASGGSGSYAYAWSGLPTGCSSSGNASDSCIPTGAGNFSVTVTVTDSNGWSTTSSVLTYRVDTDPATTSPTGSAPSSDVGQAINFTTRASGGSAGYSYSWSGLPPGCHSMNATSLSCTPTTPGTYSVTVNVTDSNGVVVQSATLTFRVFSDPSVASFGASPSTMLEGSGTALAVGVSGGSGPFTYSYSGLPSGCSSRDVPSLSCTPSESGTFTIVVTITDANGGKATATTTLTVNPALFGLPPIEVYLIVGALGAVIAAGTIVYIVRRRRKGAGGRVRASPEPTRD